MAVFFTADTHFGHGGARGLFRRPFASVHDMDEAMIQRWNESVRPADEVWHLGDFAVRRSAAEMTRILAALHGKVHLIAGNNDGPETVALRDFASVHHYFEMEMEGVHLVLCHYPFRSWNRMARGAVNLHGHSHGRLKRSRGSSTSGWMSGTSDRSRSRRSWLLADHVQDQPLMKLTARRTAS